MLKKYKENQKYLVVIGFISVAVYLISQSLSNDQTVPYSKMMLEAAQIMEQMTTKIQQARIEAGLDINLIMDPNQTGLIGPEQGDLTTSLGHLQAKRTSTNPNIASLLVYLFKKAGIEKGDTIAIGASASFPALLVATLSACKAMEVAPVAMISLGASSHGATDSQFNLLDIYQILYKEQVVYQMPAVISLGGEDDFGAEFTDSVKKYLLQQIHNSGSHFINQKNLRKNVQERIKIYGDQKISCFVNIGGSEANLGESPLVLHVKPGLNTRLKIPDTSERGVLFEMAAHSIPIIHLLYIKGLVLQYGLPWDPAPLPKPGENPISNSHRPWNIPLFILTLLYFTTLSTLFSIQKQKNKK